MRIKNQWSEVSLKDYIEICDIIAIDMDELDKQVKILSILSGVSEDKLCQMSLPHLKEAIRHCQFIYSLPKDMPVRQSITIAGQRFIINTFLNEITGGEYIDMVSLTKDKELITKNLPQIIAIFLKPVNWFRREKKGCFENGTQTLESRNKTAKLIEENLMMDEVMRMSGFFLRSWTALTKATLDYSIVQNQKMTNQLLKEIKKDSKSFGVGI